MTTASEKLEKSLEANLKTEFDESTDENVSGSFVTVVLPILIDVLSRIMEQCGNNTPQRAAKRLKRLGPWQRNNIRRAVTSNSTTEPHATECCNGIHKTIEDASEEDLVEMLNEHDEESLDWSPFGQVAGDTYTLTVEDEESVEDEGEDS